MISKWLHTHGTVRADFTALARELAEQQGPLLVQAALTGEHAMGQHGSVGTDLLIDDGPHARVVSLLVDVGPATRHGDVLTMPITWTPAQDSERLPPFDGELVIEPLDPVGVQLGLSGRYRLDPGSDFNEATALTWQAVERIRHRVASRLAAATTPGTRHRGAGSLHLRVADVMTRDVVAVSAELPVRQTVELLLRHGFGGVPVLSSAGRLVGVLTEADLLPREAAQRTRHGPAAREEARRRAAETVGEACSRPALTTHPQTTLQEAARQLLDADVSRLVVIDQQEVVGIITRRDVLRALDRSHAAVQTDIEEELTRLGADQVRAEVAASGAVLLTGRCRSRAALDALLGAISRIDGITTVQERVRLPVAPS
jgi:CBS domain-containing protein